MVKVGFCLIRKAPKIGIAVLNFNDGHESSQELLAYLSQGAHLEPERRHPRTGVVEDLVVGVRAEADLGYYESL